MRHRQTDGKVVTLIEHLLCNAWLKIKYVWLLWYCIMLQCEV